MNLTDKFSSFFWRSIRFLSIALALTACKGSLESPLDRAQHLFNQKKYKKALRSYQKHIDSATDPEEIWFSTYMTGACHDHLGNWERASSCYLNAYQLDPKRPEPLLKLSTHYRQTAQNDLCHLFGKRGASLIGNTGRLTDDSYEQYKLHENLSIASYYTDFKEDGFEAANTLLLKKGLSWEARNLAAKNILFYIKDLPSIQMKKIEPELPFIEYGVRERYRPMNPSICKTNNGYLLLCRSVNYYHEGAWDYTPISSDGVIRTRNFLMELTKDFEPIKQVEIDDDLEDSSLYSSSWVRGMEDLRLFTYNGEHWFTCTIPKSLPQVALCKLGKEVNQGKRTLERMTILEGPDPNRMEKNWLPFEAEGKISVVYSSDPTVIYHPDVETGKCVLSHWNTPKSDFSRFRGSAPPIPFMDGHLMLIHEVCFNLVEKNRVYSHRFVYMDKNFHIKKISKPFKFKHLGVEYCCGMTLNHNQRELVLTFGVEDSEAYLTTTAVETVLNMLEDYE